MRAERTFWEKATAIHVYCGQGVFRGGDRFARHWHDVTRLDAAGFADSAIKDTALAKAVAGASLTRVEPDGLAMRSAPMEPNGCASRELRWAQGALAIGLRPFRLAPAGRGN